MTTSIPTQAYTQGTGTSGINTLIHYDVRSPATTDVNYKLGTRWIDSVNNTEYTLTSFSSLGGAVSATWVSTGSSAGTVSQLTGDSGIANPSAGVINILGTSNQVDTVGSGNQIVISTPTDFTAPGNITATTTINTLDGNITAVGDFIAAKDSPGDPVRVSVSNLDTTDTGSDAGVELTVGGGSGGSPYISFLVDAAPSSSWVMGADNDDAYKLKFCDGPVLGSNDVFSITHSTQDVSFFGDTVTVNNSATIGLNANSFVTIGNSSGTTTVLVEAGSGNINLTGNVLKSTNPAFLAYLATTVNAVTGNGATYVLGTNALTEVFDRGNNFNTNGTFTAPVTGLYLLQAGITVTNVTAANSFQIFLNTTARNYEAILTKDTGTNADQSMYISALCDMSANDTATVSIIVDGEGGDSDGIRGSGSPVGTYFCGSLVA
jgi:hypothetical protein